METPFDTVPQEVEESVIEDIRARRDLGRRKYNKSMDRNDLSKAQWARHLYEELLDSAIYTKRLIRELERSEKSGDPEPDDLAEFMLHPEC